jgi:hypothetical protein
MQLFLMTCRFLGSWLLVAGPILQAALELQGLDFELSKVRQQMRDAAPAKVSPLWWLLPPIKLVLERRYLREARDRMVQALSYEEFEGLLEFTNKATGWLYVAGGGLLLAISATDEVVGHFHWPWWALVAGCVALLVVASFNMRVRLRKTRTMLDHKRSA